METFSRPQLYCVQLVFGRGSLGTRSQPLFAPATVEQTVQRIIILLSASSVVLGRAVPGSAFEHLYFALPTMQRPKTSADRIVKDLST